MRKFLLIFLLLFVVTILFVYFSKARLVSTYLSYDFKIPITIKKIEFNENRMDNSNVEIQNLRKSNSEHALYANQISLTSTLNEFFGETLTIEEISFKDLDINIEYYDENGKENNWSDIIKVQTKVSGKSKPYLIKRLIFENLYVSLFKTDGSEKTFPVIEKLELSEISSDSGFPPEQIEKAVFNAVLNSIFDKFGLSNLLQTINPGVVVPKVLHPSPILWRDQRNEN